MPSETITSRIAHAETITSHITHAMLIAGLRVDLAPDLVAVMAEATEALRYKTSWLMTCVNPGSAGLVRRQAVFAAALQRFDLVASDGIAVTKTVNWLLRRAGRDDLSLARVSFDSTSLAPLIFDLAGREGYTVALCGGAPGVAETAAKTIQTLYPAVKIVGVFNGFIDIEQLVFDIVKLNPALVICGMGSLHQELLLLGLRDRNWSGVGFTCGGYLDQLSAGFNYYPPWVDRLNLRFAYRLYKEPGRLWRRYVLDYPRFWLCARGFSIVNRKGRF